MVDRFLNWTIWGNLSFVELYWCLLMGLGLLLAIYNVWDALRDQRRLIQEGVNGIAKATVRTSIRGDTLRAIELAAGLSIGLFGAFAPPSPLAPTSAFYWWYRLVTTLAILLMGNCIVVNTVSIQHYRRHVLTLYEEERGVA